MTIDFVFVFHSSLTKELVCAFSRDVPELDQPIPGKRRDEQDAEVAEAAKGAVKKEVMQNEYTIMEHKRIHSI